MYEEELRNIARESVEDLAPNEIQLFDAIWSEAMDNPLLLQSGTGKRDRHLGVGAMADVNIMSLVVIPIVIAIGRDLGVSAVKQVTEYARKLLRERTQATSPVAPLSDAEIERVAEVIAERFKARR